MESQTIKVVVVGAGFAGLNVARKLAGIGGIEVTVIDRRNYHLFQPLLYQVAMAGLSPAEIAAPIRSLLSGHANVQVVMDEIVNADFSANRVFSQSRSFPYDYLVLSCGVTQDYFGNDAWEQFAPGLKTLEQATEIRRRVLLAFESAENETNAERQREMLTFVVVGGGPTGVELAGSLGEMTRFCLGRDFKHINPAQARVILIEAASEILAGFHSSLVNRAVRDLEELGVQVWTNSRVTSIDETGIGIGAERFAAKTVLWAAGVGAEKLSEQIGVSLTTSGKVPVDSYCRIEGYGNVFVVGDQAAFTHAGQELPGVAPVAIQQGRYIAATITALMREKPVKPFRYLDKGQMATIGRSRAIVQSKGLRFHGLIAWVMWLVVHIYFLIGFKNRLFVLLQWAWHYFTFKRGARLIVNKEWKQHQKFSIQFRA